VATYKELDNDFQKHSYLMTLVGKCFTNPALAGGVVFITYVLANFVNMSVSLQG
jgi:hypothetical protein